MSQSITSSRKRIDLGISFRRNYLKPICHLAAYSVCALLSYLIPKKKNKVTFFCNESGLFGGNIKPTFVYAKENYSDYDLTLLSFKSKAVNDAEELGAVAFRYPSILGVWTFLRSESVVIECGMRLDICGLMMNSNVYQIWHGANLKYMVKQLDEITQLKNYSAFRKVNRLIQSNLPKYRFVVSPSIFYKENTFSKSFNSKEVLVAGYPRNDLFFRETREEDWVSSDENIIKKAIKHRQEGGKVVLYCPTWRDQADKDENVNPFSDKLIEFVTKNNIYFVVKKHHRDPRTVYDKDHTLIDTYPFNKDIYLLMKNSDLMISDYSSIFFDYLLLDKPVVFYPYDYELYMSRDRKFQYDYEAFTAGKKCKAETELYEEMTKALDDKNYFQDERNRIKELAFGKIPCSNSSRKIFDELIKHQGK